MLNNKVMERVKEFELLLRKCHKKGAVSKATTATGVPKDSLVARAVLAQLFSNLCYDPPTRADVALNSGAIEHALGVVRWRGGVMRWLCSLTVVCGGTAPHRLPLCQPALTRAGQRIMTQSTASCSMQARASLVSLR